MLSLFGSALVVKNIYILGSRYRTAGQKISRTSHLKPLFLRFLREHQPQQPINSSGTLFVREHADVLRLRRAYCASGLDDLGQAKLMGEPVDHFEQARLEDLVTSGLDHLERCKPQAAELFRLVVHSIFFCKSEQNSVGAISFGGSSSTAIGAIWISGHGHLNKHDVAEFLLHELTHHLLFIAERCTPQFHYAELTKPENFARSAILNCRRPLDKVVHSIVVSVEILLARRRFLAGGEVSIHPGSDILLARINESINDVLTLSNKALVITPWTEALLLRCREAVNSARHEAC